MAETYSAGIVTAYGAARRGGYTGTYEQFCAEQARFAENAQAVHEDREAVEATVTTFENVTVPNAVQSVTDEGTTQVGLVTAEGTTQISAVNTAGGTQASAVNEAGTTNVNAVNQTGTAKVNAINSAGTTQVGNVNTAGTTQVGNVNQAGATQVQAIEDKGEEVLESIPADYTALANTVNDPVTGLDTKAPAIVNTASGAIASFSDGADGMPVKKLVVAVEPVQDLHGYDNPWPAGGGNNRLDLATVPDENKYILSNTGATGTPSSGTWRYTDYIPVTPGEELFFGQVYSTASTAGTAYYDSNKDYVSGFSAQSLSNSGGVKTVPEGVAYMRHSFNIGSDFNPNWQQTLYITLNSNPHVWTPYSNICPISGWTGAEIEGTGKNFFDPNSTGNEWVNSSLRIVSRNGAKSCRFRVAEGQKIVLSNANTASNENILELAWLDSGGNVISRSTRASQYNFITGTAPAGAVSVIGCFYTWAEVSDAQFEYAEIPSSYEPFTGTQISVTFPSSAGTVYGCTLTINPDRTGQLVVDRACITVTVCNSVSAASTGMQTAAVSLSQLGEPERASNTIISSVYKATYFSAPSTSGWFRVVRDTAYLYDSRFIDKATADEILTAEKPQIYYPLATPIAYTLTASEIDGILTTLYGTNNIWADCGDTTVTYAADSKMFIENKIAEAIANALNS